jgi:molybdopterin-guanine dinucleotide biosynthesis protein A
LLPEELFARLISSNGDGAAVLDSIGAVRVRFADPAAFANVNTREEFAALAARFESVRQSFTSDTDAR